MQCSLCDSNRFKEVDAHFVQCLQCEGFLRISKQWLSPQEEFDRYLKHQNQVEDLKYQAFTQGVTDYILQHYGPEHQGLDFGCGPGPVISHQLNQKGLTPILYDKYFLPETRYKDYKYDYIFCCEVFEHLKEVKNDVLQLKSLLKPGGRLIVQTGIFRNQAPFKGWNYRNDPTHIFIFTPKTVEYLANALEFKIEQFEQNLFCLVKES